MRRALEPGTRVLVRLPAWLGDCVMAEPLVRALLERDLALTLTGFARFAQAFGWTSARGVRFLDLARGSSPDVATWRGHDVALLLDGSWRGALAAARAGIPERIGYAGGGRALLLTQSVRPALERGRVPLGLGVAGRGDRRLPRPFTSTCIELVALLGLEVREREPRIEPPASTIERVATRLARHGVGDSRRCVLVHAGARAGSAKAVPVATWGSILGHLGERLDAPVVLVCAPGEEEPARALAQILRNAVLLDDPPLDIAETAAAHRFALLALSPDGGSAHLARAASCVPLVVLHGPTDPRHVAEHRPLVVRGRVEVSCGPCHFEECWQPTEAHHHQCMRRLDPLRVAERAIELLARTA